MADPYSIVVILNLWNFGFIGNALVSAQIYFILVWQFMFLDKQRNLATFPKTLK